MTLILIDRLDIYLDRFLTQSPAVAGPAQRTLMSLKMLISCWSLRDEEEGILGDPGYWAPDPVTAPCEEEVR